MSVPIEFYVSDLNDQKRKIRVLKFSYVRGYPATLTQPGETDFIEDVEVEWADTGELLTDADWKHYDDQIMETLFKEIVQ